ncbi:hypothetical protein ABPG74_018754 [Tetrahymena malaccensis]
MSVILGQETNNSFLQSSQGIEQTYSVQLKKPNVDPKTQRGYYFMRTDDIDGASPCKNRFANSCQRKTNPLMPEYKLPSLNNLNQSQQSINTTFIRDSLNVRDIEGTSAKPRNWNYQRNKDPYTEIEGSKTRQRRILSKPNYQYDVQDINKDGIHKRNRSTNPLEPRYDIPYEKNYGYIEGTESLTKKPKIYFKQRQSNFNRDIELAWANSGNEKRYFIDSRRQLKNPLNISDIEGTSTEQNKYKFSTKRHINPLNPSYLLPGHSEKLNSEDFIRKPHYKHQQI